MQKEFLGFVFSARWNSNFRENGLSKLTFKIGRYFPEILSFANFFSIFRQVFTTQGKNMLDMWPLAKKIRPLTLRCGKLERFKVKMYNFAENLPLTGSIFKVEPYASTALCPYSDTSPHLKWLAGRGRAWSSHDLNMIWFFRCFGLFNKLS